MASKFNDAPDGTSRFSDFVSDSPDILPPIQGFEDKPLVSLEEAAKPLASLVPQIDHMVWTVKRKCNQPKDGLSKDESASIMLYTLEWTPPERSFYFILNTTLRSENRRQLIPWFLYLRLVIHALSKLPPSSSRVIYRGVKLDLSAEYSEGKEFFWWAFSSCTSSIGVLENYIGKTGKRTIFNVVLHSAVDISQHSFFQTEKEYLLYLARQFKVSSLLDTGNELHIIELEETQPPFCLIPLSQTLSTNLARKSNQRSIGTSVSSKITTKSKQNTQLITIHRRAIDASGSLGSFYDIRRDCVLEEQTIKDEVTKKQLLEPIRCEPIDGNTEKSKNVFKMIGIDYDLRRSILLRSKLRTGVAAVVDHCRPTDEFTRFLYTFYRSQELRLSDDSIKAKIRAKFSSSDERATHIITAVTYGFDAVVVLQLPYNDNTARKIDIALNKIRTQLENSNDVTDFTTDDANALEKITEIKIYSNITELTEMISLPNICHYIRKLKKSQTDIVH